METHDETLKIETEIGALRPASRLDRDALLFEAGRAAGRRSRDRLWAGAAAGLLLVSAVEGAFLATRPGPRVVERLIVIHEPAALPETQTLDAPPESPAPRPLPSWPLTESPQGRLQRQILRYGLDGLSPSPIGPAALGAADMTVGGLLRSELEALNHPGGPT